MSRPCAWCGRDLADSPIPLLVRLLVEPSTRAVVNHVARCAECQATLRTDPDDVRRMCRRMQELVEAACRANEPRHREPAT